MVDQATAKYLNDNIGSVLAKALSESAVAQPTDNVDFLARWLKTYAEQEELKAFQQKEAASLEAERAEMQKQQDEKRKKVAHKEAVNKGIMDEFQALLSKFNNTETVFEPAFWDQLVNVAKQSTGAQAVYLGLQDDEGLEGVEPPCIRYTNASAGSETMLKQVLPKETGMTFGALQEAVPDEELEAKCLWKPPAPPVPEVADGEEPPPPPAGPKYLPVSVPCVTDVSSMHYFEMPRLGAYLATPLVYSSYYTQEAFAEAKRFEEEKAADAQKRAEEEAEREAARVAAEEAGQEPPELPELEPQEEKVMTLPPSTVKMVLCIDTLGTNTLLDESKIPMLMEVCNACAECKGRSEIKEVDDQALFFIDAARKTADDEELTEKKATAETEMQTVLDTEMQAIADKGLDPDPKKALEEVLAKKFAFFRARKVLVDFKEKILALVKACHTVSPDMLNTFAALAFLVGYKKEEVYPERKTALQWLKLKTVLLESTFFDKVDALELDTEKTGLAPEHKLVALRALMPSEFTAETGPDMAKELDPSFECLWSFLMTVIEYRTAYLNQLKAEYEARKKEAEEAEAAFTEPALEERDDDFEGLSA